MRGQGSGCTPLSLAFVFGCAADRGGGKRESGKRVRRRDEEKRRGERDDRATGRRRVGAGRVKKVGAPKEGIFGRIRPPRRTTGWGVGPVASEKVALGLARPRAARGGWRLCPAARAAQAGGFSFASRRTYLRVAGSASIACVPRRFPGTMSRARWVPLGQVGVHWSLSRLRRRLMISFVFVNFCGYS